MLMIERETKNVRLFVVLAECSAVSQVQSSQEHSPPIKWAFIVILGQDSTRERIGNQVVSVTSLVLLQSP